MCSALLATFSAQLEVEVISLLSGLLNQRQAYLPDTYLKTAASMV